MEENNKKMILFIEDDEQLSELAQIHLEKEGYDVTLALNGKEGMDLAMNRDFDLILLDLMLPDVQGEEILEAMQKKGRTDKIPVLVLTNKMDGATYKNVKELGAKDFMIKANNPLNEITKKINYILKRGEISEN